MFKGIFGETAISEFWISFNSKFPRLSNKTVEYLLPFQRSYLCEHRLKNYSNYQRRNAGLSFKDRLSNQSYLLREAIANFPLMLYHVFLWFDVHLIRGFVINYFIFCVQLIVHASLINFQNVVFFILRVPRNFFLTMGAATLNRLLDTAVDHRWFDVGFVTA